ncbi:MAG: hypothetical protein HUU55_20200 [Myxococcales bacterium]|nr:hypothetical protein [Myxococcales bacterium]
MKQEQSIALVRQILGDRYLDLTVERYQFTEDLTSGNCTFSCHLSGGSDQPSRDVIGHGVGFVDAVFHALKNHLAPMHPSLNSVRFVGFEIRADLATRRHVAGSDAIAALTLVVENSQGRRFEFNKSSRSITACAVIATLEACEYFVNTEVAFITLHHALQDAKTRNRADLADRFSMQMAGLVENTSYSDIIDRLRSQS